MSEPSIYLLHHAMLPHIEAVAQLIGVKIYPGSVDSKHFITVPAELDPSVSTIVPVYGIGYATGINELFVAALMYDEESGQIVFPADYDGEKFTTEPIAIVFDHRYPGENDFTRYVAVVEKDPNDPGGVLYRVKEYVEAPAVLELTAETESGTVEQVYLPLGSPILGLLAPWLLRLIVAGTASIASYALLKHAEAEKKASEAVLKAVDYAISNRKTEVIAALVSGAAGARYEKQTNGRLVDAVKKALAELAAPAAALLAMFLKFTLIIELVRSIQRR